MIDFHCSKTHLLAGFYHTSRVTGVSPDVAAGRLISFFPHCQHDETVEDFGTFKIMHRR